MSITPRRLLAAAAALALVAAVSVTGLHTPPSAAHPGESDDQHHITDGFGLYEREALDVQGEEQAQRGIMTCDRLQPLITKGGFTDPVFVLSDADLIPDTPGARFCLFWDNLADAYSAWPINQKSPDQFRQTKADMLPLLEAYGIDVCKIGFFSPAQTTNGKATNFTDWHDYGRFCEL